MCIRTSYIYNLSIQYAPNAIGIFWHAFIFISIFWRWYFQNNYGTCRSQFFHKHFHHVLFVIANAACAHRIQNIFNHSSMIIFILLFVYSIRPESVCHVCANIAILYLAPQQTICGKRFFFCK